MASTQQVKNWVKHCLQHCLQNNLRPDALCITDADDSSMYLTLRKPGTEIEVGQQYRITITPISFPGDTDGDI